MDMPACPFDACDQATGQVNSQSLVRDKTDDYSVPVAYGRRDVWLRGYVDQVVIGCGGDVIARHPRCWDREDIVLGPVHYLPLLEQKVTSGRARNWKPRCTATSGSTISSSRNQPSGANRPCRR